MSRIKSSLSKILIVAGGCLVAIAAQAQTSVDIGVIEQAQRVTLQSSGAGGAVAGGVIGYNLGSGNSSSKKRRRAVIGAAAGSAAASDTTPGMEYTVKFMNGSTMAIISDQLDLELGECVSVEQSGSSANIRRQDPAACKPESAAAVEALQDELVEEADECAQAKQEVLDAADAEALELATTKAKILCN